MPGGLAGAIGPAADLESSVEARAFARNRPHSAVWLEVEDDAEGLHFAVARSLLDTWRDERTLVLEDAPAYYVYEHEFDDRGVRRTRRGIFGLVPQDAADVCVLPHEETWEENRQRRLQLLRDLDASISPVFLIYDSESTGHSPRRLMEEITRDEPDVQTTDDVGDAHRLWVVSDPSVVTAIAETMRGQHYIIADGHHRFAAAQLHHRERGMPETALVLAYCVDADDPGVVIRPIHRLVTNRDALDWLAAVGKLHEWFEIETEPLRSRTGEELLRTLGEGELPVAGIIVNDGLTFVRLTLRSWQIAEQLLPDELPDVAKTLDVSIVTELVIRRALDVSASAESSTVTFLADADEVLTGTRDHGGIGILMRPIRLGQVLAVARAHARVPAKSTSFIPKVPIGLVMHQFRVPPPARTAVTESTHPNRNVVSPSLHSLGTRNPVHGTDE